MLSTLFLTTIHNLHSAGAECCVPMSRTSVRSGKSRSRSTDARSYWHVFTKQSFLCQQVLEVRLACLRLIQKAIFVALS